jgi:uncharacterized protein YbjT (DUF2867 family)
LQQGKYTITVISRATSAAAFPQGVTARKRELDDQDFLVSALHGHDVVFFMLGLGGWDYQKHIINAAAKTGVKYVVPSAYGMPTNDYRVKELPLLKGVVDVYEHIKEMGMKYVVFVANTFTDWVCGTTLSLL